MPIYFEDIQPGDEVIVGSRTITETDVVAFGCLTGDHGPIHTDREFAEKTQFGGRIAHGLMGTAYALGLMSTADVFKGGTIAFMEVVSWKFLKPILIGDTVACRHIIEEKVDIGKPDRAVVLRRMEVTNQHGVMVQSGVFKYLVRRKPAE